jgi:LPS O-antigen subunit length determinant protein (WzzB/FepE family)
MRTRSADFRRDAEKKMQEYDAKIAELKTKMVGADAKEREKYNEKIAKLEAKNNELRQKLQNYKYESDSNWQEFKREFNHDMDEMGNAFKDIGRDNVK